MSVLAVARMRKSHLLAVALVGALTLSVAGCGDDDDGGGGSGDRCHDGCVATIAAMCPISPDSQESCESDCRGFESGSCATEYKAFQDCAEGKAITCNTIGIPTVAGCDNQQAAFIACM